MRDGTASQTAAWVAVARGHGLLLPREARLAEDPYGTRFALPGGLMPGWAARLALRLAPPYRSGILYMQVRTRVLDDDLLSFAAAGGRQVVLLGAGYDCRALRFAQALDGGTVFEVDHPATQARKRSVLGEVPAVRYLEWDFEARPLRELPDALGASGHQTARSTLTIWEGVTMYLTPDAIDATVRAVRAWSAPGSMLALTYFTRELVDRPTGARRLFAMWVRGSGEPFRFGWDPAELPAWLAARGFTLERDASMAQEARRLLPAGWALAVREGGQRIALARAA